MALFRNIFSYELYGEFEIDYKKFNQKRFFDYGVQKISFKMTSLNIHFYLTSRVYKKIPHTT